MPHYPPLVEGNSASPVRVVIFEDLQCKDCAWLRRKLDEVLLPAYGDHVAFEHKDFPLAKHDWAAPAAMAARYFSTVGHGTGIAFRRNLLADMSIVTKESLPDWIREFAADYGANAAQAIAAMNNPKIAAVVEADRQQGVQRDVEKTPTVFLNDIAFIERIPLPELSAAIDAALGKKR